MCPKQPACAQVCRSAGYYEHALHVAQAAGEPEWYLDILLEDCQQYDEALAYLQDLHRQQAAAALTRHGKVGGLQTLPFRRSANIIKEEFWRMMYNGAWFSHSSMDANFNRFSGMSVKTFLACSR